MSCEVSGTADGVLILPALDSSMLLESDMVLDRSTRATSRHQIARPWLLAVTTHDIHTISSVPSSPFHSPTSALAMAPKHSGDKKPAQPAKKAVAKKSTGGKRKGGSKKAVESYKIYIYKVCVVEAIQADYSTVTTSSSS